MPEKLRIFISSPGDVSEERRRAALVISRLKREFFRFFELSAALWEYEPMLSSGHFQDVIEPPSAADVMVLILWSRLGTPLPLRTAVREYRRRDGSAPVTGTEWEFEDALAAKHARGLPELLVYRKFEDGVARFSRAEQLDQIRQQWEALQYFWQQHFEGPDGRFKAAFNRFETLEQFESQLESHLRELLRRRLPSQPTRLAHGSPGARIEWWSGSPFGGLKAFDIDQTAVFFGRERAEREIIERLVGSAGGFMLVLGASGSGKSSLVRAGVLPDLMAPGVVTGVPAWRYVILQPAELAPDPFSGLAAALLRRDVLPELESIGYRQTDLAALLAGDPGLALIPLRTALERAANGSESPDQEPPRRARLVLVLDQLETLLTSGAFTPESIRAFDALLARLSQSELVFVIATLRSDLYHRFAELPQLSGFANGFSQFHLAFPGVAEIEQIIRGPADAAGLLFEIDEHSGIRLDAVILQAAVREPASLPLLSFVLDELYHRDAAESDSHVLTYASYRALGELEGAIARHADEFVKTLSPEQASALPTLLLSLVEVDEGKSSVTARIIRRSMLTNELQRQVADKIVAARLVVADNSGTDEILRLAHEALITRWPLLNKLIDDHRDFLGVRRRLQIDAATWQQRGHDPDFLLPPGRRLAEGEEVLGVRPHDLDPELTAYIRASIKAEGDRQAAIQLAKEKQLRDQLTRSRRVAAAVSVLLVLAVAAGLYAWWQRSIANAALKQAQQNYELALDQATGSLSLLVEGYDRGAILTRLLRDLMERSQKTVDGLPNETDDLSAARIQLLDVMSMANVVIGRADESRRFAEQELAIAQPLAAKYPENAAWKRLHGIAQERLAEALFAQGDLPRAVSFARAGQAILTQLAAAAPGDEKVLWEINLSRQRIGDILRAQGDLDGADKEYRLWLQLADELVTRQPNNALWQRAMAFAYQRLGDVLQTQGKAADAEKEFRNYLARIDRLAAADPTSAIFLEGQVFSRQRLGDALLAQGDTAGAMAQYREYRQLATRLLTFDPASFRWQELAEFTHQRIGDVLLRQRDYAGALAEYRTYLSMAEEAREKDPANSAILYDVSNAHEKIGDVLSAQGDLAGALSEYRQELAVAKELIDKHPSNATWLKNLATAHQRIGATLRTQGQTVEAIAAFRECAAIPTKSFVWTPRSNSSPDLKGDCEREMIALGKRQ
jgi:eukaryotic-like serine/threonine-protein kinase